MAPKQLYLVPAEDPSGPHGRKQVRNPDRNFAPLPPEGEWVESSAYWWAQLRDGAVLEAAAPPPQ